MMRPTYEEAAERIIAVAERLGLEVERTPSNVFIQRRRRTRRRIVLTPRSEHLHIRRPQDPRDVWFPVDLSLPDRRDWSDDEGVVATWLERTLDALGERPTPTEVTKALRRAARGAKKRRKRRGPGDIWSRLAAGQRIDLAYGEGSGKTIGRFSVACVHTDGEPGRRMAILRRKPRGSLYELRQDARGRLTLRTPTGAAHGVSGARFLGGRASRNGILMTIANPAGGRRRPGARKVREYIVPLRSAPRDAETREAVRRYRRFHKETPDRVRILEYDDGRPGVEERTLFRIGDADIVIDTPEGPLEIGTVYRVPASARSRKAGKQWVHSHREGGGKPPFHAVDIGTGLMTQLGGSYEVEDWIRR